MQFVGRLLRTMTLILNPLLRHTCDLTLNQQFYLERDLTHRLATMLDLMLSKGRPIYDRDLNYGDDDMPLTLEMSVGLISYTDSTILDINRPLDNAWQGSFIARLVLAFYRSSPHLALLVELIFQSRTLEFVSRPGTPIGPVTTAATSR
ncbi:Uncharacterized protein TCM_002587 [Theobroma cacao]|uniref:Uncharacterized protein n=1 Tax=Theobroma cacao TaxID=3641 RepID=A0A061DNR5_THECC|nr:Uncharacterized protein TCM_002587 [Theobroma cacao]